MKKLLILFFLLIASMGYSQVSWTDTTNSLGLPDHNVSQTYPLPTQVQVDTSFIWATDTCVGVADSLTRKARYSITTLLSKFPNRMRLDITADSSIQISTAITFPAGATFLILAGESFGFENFKGATDIYIRGYNLSGNPVGVRRYRVSAKGW